VIDRRTAPRISIRVQLEGRKNGDVFQGTSINVSETGIMIETNKSLHLGDQITIRFILPGQEEVVGVGRVVRQEDFDVDKFGYAVHWSLTDDQRLMIAGMIEASRPENAE
jgi:hypothetical protein